MGHLFVYCMTYWGTFFLEAVADMHPCADVPPGFAYDWMHRDKFFFDWFCDPSFQRPPSLPRYES